MAEQLAIKVFVVLISGDSNRSEVFTVERNTVSDVKDLCDKVLAIFPNALAGVERFCLRVFANEEDYRRDSQLGEIHQIGALGAVPNQPIFVECPSESVAKRSRNEEHFETPSLSSVGANDTVGATDLRSKKENKDCHNIDPGRLGADINDGMRELRGEQRNSEQILEENLQTEAVAVPLPLSMTQFDYETRLENILRELIELLKASEGMN
jgi:hypothetical protein